MIIVPTRLDGVLLVHGEPARDVRGSFVHHADVAALASSGFEMGVTNVASSTNDRRGTLRGLHYQRPPATESKVVWCARGRLFDVAVDLRPSSPSFRSWFGIELAADDDLALAIPEGCAHGFLTLEDHTTVGYALSAQYDPAASAGVRWNDPGLGIDWPEVPTVISERDRAMPDVVWDDPGHLW